MDKSGAKNLSWSISRQLNVWENRAEMEGWVEQVRGHNAEREKMPLAATRANDTHAEHSQDDAGERGGTVHAVVVVRWDETRERLERQAEFEELELGQKVQVQLWEADVVNGRLQEHHLEEAGGQLEEHHQSQVATLQNPESKALPPHLPTPLEPHQGHCDYQSGNQKPGPENLDNALPGHSEQPLPLAAAEPVV